MLGLTTTAGKDHRFARIRARLATDLRKESLESVIVFHRPTIKRMIVALGALNPHAEESLGDVFGEFANVWFGVKKIGWRR